MKITLELPGEVVSHFPKIAVGGFAVEDLSNVIPHLGNLTERFHTVRGNLESIGLTPQNIATERKVAGWREAFRHCGLKPSTYKSSVEQLARRFLMGKGISTPLPIVNLYCAVSAQHLAPLGGYDVQRLPESNIALRMGRPATDHFRPLFGKVDQMRVESSIPVYASGDEVLCWAFNHRDSHETCLLTETNTAIFFSEAVTPEHRRAMFSALADLSGILEGYGARISPTAFVDSESLKALIQI